MKLTKNDTDILIGFGYSEQDIKQIQKATSERYTVYELNNKKVSLDKILEVLDRKEYLSGIARSAFHWSALRHTKDGQEVFFDSSKLFK